MKDASAARGHLRVDKFDAAGRWVDAAEGHNAFLTAGVNELWRLVCGASANTLTNATAQIGVGDSTAATTLEMTDLQAPVNKAYRGMEPNFPSTPAAGQVQFRASFGPDVANWSWSEFVVRQSVSGICIDRGTGNFGTKAPGTTWVATVTLTIS